MALAACRDLAETFLSLNPREGPRNVAVVFKVLGMSVGVTFLKFAIGEGAAKGGGWGGDVCPEVDNAEDQGCIGS